MEQARMIYRGTQDYYHTCGVEPKKDRKPGGKLERFHGVASIGDYRAGQDMRPDWIKQRERKRKRRAARGVSYHGRPLWGFPRALEPEKERTWQSVQGAEHPRGKSFFIW